jgi:hypothetical protein
MTTFKSLLGESRTSGSHVTIQELEMAKYTGAQKQKTAAPTFAPLRSDVLQRKCVCGQHTVAGGKCAAYHKKRQSLQRYATNQAEPTTVPPIVHDVLRSPGQPLDPTTRTSMESRFGHDLSRVRVHTNAKAAASADTVRALAYTVGTNIVFGRNRFKPGTVGGRELISHELVHVLQQSSRSSVSEAKPHPDPSNGVAEREADVIAEQVAGAQTGPGFLPVSVSMMSKPIVQKRPTFSSDCDEYDRCRVVEPIGAANQMLDRVLAELPPIASGTITSGRSVDLVNVHFHDPSATAARAAAVLETFREIKTELNANIKYICHPPERECESEEESEGRIGAFTACSKGSDVGLCNTYYAVACVEQARMLIHEMAHHVLGSCTDYAYVHQSGYMALPPERASRNPDTFAQFAKMVFLGTPSCRECSTEVQLRPGQY